MPLIELSNSKKLGVTRAAHLLRRCTFKVTPKRIRDFADLTASQAVDYLFDFSGNPVTYTLVETGQPKTFPANPDLMFPQGPIWHEDGAPIHPANRGAGNVNHVGFRNYIHAPGCQDKVMYLKYDGVQVENLTYYEKISEAAETINIYGTQVDIEKGTMVITHTFGVVEITILRIWNSVSNQHDLFVYQNPTNALTINESLYTIHFIKPLDSYLTATYIQSYMFSWRMYESLQDTSIRWKLVCWINSLFTTKIERQHYHYPHWKLMYDFVNGMDITNGFTNDGKSYANSLKALVFAMTYSNEMLLYLDNNVNTKNGPNENYARELLELFTILKDPNSTEEGNYVNYTEQDIVAAAKVLTGFKDDGNHFDTIANRPWGKKVFANHDTSNKTFSSAFGGKTIVGASNTAEMDRELWDFIHMIFDQDVNANSTNPNVQPTAHAYIRKMYRYFVNDTIDTTIEDNIISELANDLYLSGSTQQGNFLYLDVLKNLLKSEHFYEDGMETGYSPCNSLIGSKIKSPLELLLTTINLLEIKNQPLTDLSTIYQANVNQLVDRGYFIEDRTVYYIDVEFGSDRPCQIIGIQGPYLDSGSDTTVPADHIRIFYAVKGDNHSNLLTEGLLTKNDIRNVFHSYMYTQFGVPLQLCSFNLAGPDTVEGYRGYYKEENYSKNWLDSSNFYNRYSFGRTFLDGITAYRGSSATYENKPIQYKADLTDWVINNIDTAYPDLNPTQPNPNASNVGESHLDGAVLGPATDVEVVVFDMLTYFLPIPPEVGTDRFNYFKNVFLGDLHPFAWSVIWIHYLYDPVNNRMEAETPLYNLCKAITESHEFQTF